MVSDGENLLTSSKDKSIFLWNVDRQKRIQSFYHAFGAVNSFDTFADGKGLVSTGQDRKISLWDIRSAVAVFDSDVGQKLQH